MMNLKPLALLTASLALAGCYEDKQMVLDLRSDDFYAQGFPTDLRQDDQGRIDMKGFLNPLLAFNPTIIHYRNQVRDHVRGFAPDMPLYMKFKGDLQAEDLKFLSDPLDYAKASSPVQLIDVDPDSPELGKRFPIFVEYRFEGDEYRPDEFLQVVPAGEYLRENNQYALVVTRKISPKHANKLIPNEMLNALLKGKSARSVDGKVSEARAADAAATYGALIAQWNQEGRNVDDIIGATAWTTGEPSKTLRNLVHKVAAWDTPAPSTELTLKAENDDYCIIEASWNLPTIQTGNFPFVTPLDGGAVQYSAEGEPVVQSYRSTPMILTIPKTPMPQDGYPMVFYHHGTDGRATQVYERGYTQADGTLTPVGSPAHIAASRGWAASGMGGHMGADHQDQLPALDALADLIPGISLNIGAYNFMNLNSMKGNMMQMAAERTAFRRLVNDLSLDASLCAGADTSASYNGDIYFDTSMQVAMGQSLGSFTAGVQAANDPLQMQGFIGTGAGSYDLRLVMNLAKLPNNGPLGNVLEPLFYYTSVNDVVKDQFHPLWAISDMILAEADFSYGLANWQRSEQPASQPMPSLLVEGHFDDWVSNASQRKLIRAMQSDLVGPELNVAVEDQLLPNIQYAGGEQLSAPVTENSDDGRTNAVVRYAEDGIKSGHNVFFQYQAAQHQAGCFLQDIAAGYSPYIVAGESLAGNCMSGPAKQ